MKKGVITITYPADPMHSSEKHPRRIYATINAAVFAFNQVDRRYNLLTKLFLDYHAENEVLNGKAEPGRYTIDIGYGENNREGNYMVSLAWDVIDWSDRLRKVLGVMAGVKKTEPWYDESLNALKSVKEIRNFLQHFDGNINKFVDRSYPLMGGVCADFIVGGGVHTRLILSTPLKSAYHEEVEIHGVALPREVSKEMDNIILTVADKFVNLSKLIQALHDAKSGLALTLKHQYDFDWPKC